MSIEQSEEYGTLQRLVESLYRHKKRVTQLEVLGIAQSYDLTADLQEIVDLLPPGTYTRRKLCDQFNSAITGHGWGLIYGTVD
ncbi:hypothetical protein FACS1894104_0870 [Actinomycetota bacterium]|nr:hypothetical protein FACS1894104_0870 [Actinomycetota bacterium]